jgi:Tetracyclin repressor-like, C-terminal domain
VREKVIADRPLSSDQIFTRAHERGEIELRSISPAVLAMPFDLMRHDMLMTYKPIPEERLLAIVDDLFLPWSQPTKTTRSHNMARGRFSARAVRSWWRLQGVLR